jgi:Cys-rich repeat protein
VNWRPAVGIVVGLLLPLPLILSLSVALRPEPPIAVPEGKRLSPVLSSEERARLATYGHECGMSSECEPPLGCLMEARRGRQYCTGSQCTTDAQCPEGEVCRNLATWGDGPLVRFCVPVGVRQEGESCVKLPSDREAACLPGLLCSGQESWCARPCTGSKAATCPEGFFCADTIPEPVCLPTCEARGCPEGQHCIRFDEGASVCAHVYGPQCQQVPCPEDRECQVRRQSSQPGKVWMECAERCGEGFPPCPAGRICDGWQCEPACSPEDPDPCGEGYRCKERRPGRPFACYPDWTW